MGTDLKICGILSKKERGINLENSYSKEIEKYYGEALDVISDFKDTGFWFSKKEDERDPNDRIELYFGKEIRILIPEEISKTITDKEVYEITTDMLAYMIKKYKRDYATKTIPEINEKYMSVIDNILMKSINRDKKDIFKIMQENNCPFDQAVLIFYDQKTIQYFLDSKNKKYYNETNKKELEER